MKVTIIDRINCQSRKSLRVALASRVIKKALRGGSSLRACCLSIKGTKTGITGSLQPIWFIITTFLRKSTPNTKIANIRGYFDGSACVDSPTVGSVKGVKDRTNEIRPDRRLWVAPQIYWETLSVKHEVTIRAISLRLVELVRVARLGFILLVTGYGTLRPEESEPLAIR